MNTTYLKSLFLLSLSCLLFSTPSTAEQDDNAAPFAFFNDASSHAFLENHEDDQEFFPNILSEALESEAERQQAHDNVPIEDLPTEDKALEVLKKDASRLTSEALRDGDLYTKDPDEKKDIYLNFEGAELKNFIEYIAGLRNMNIIPDKGIAGIKISLNFKNPVSQSGAWNVFLTILEMAGFSIVKTNTTTIAPDGKSQPESYLYRIIPKDKKFKQPLPTFIGVDPKTLPDSDATIRYITFLNNIPIQEVKPLLQSMLSQPSMIVDQPNVNGFIITDCACVIKSAMQVIEELDQSDMQESVYVMKLKRVNAQDVKALFDNLITKKDNNPLAKLLGKTEETSEYFPSGTRLIVESRTNSLIMLGTKQSLEKIRTFIVDHVDTELQQAQSPLRVYELQHTNAKEVAEILREVTSNQSIQSSAGQQASRYGAVRDGVKYFKNMVFQPDIDGNRLLVSCTDDTDWQLLQETIKRIDTPQPQVAIQMLIVTVSAKAVDELGGQMRNKYHGQVGGGIDFQTNPISTTVFEESGGSPISLLGNLLNAVTMNQGATLLSLGKFAAGEDGVWGIFKALKQETDATVLSQPFLVAANRSTSKLVVGESTYIQTQQAVGTSVSGSTPEEANTTINITPQINADGVIKLDLDANISEFVPDTTANYGRTKQTKQIKTNVTIANGQVLVVGGFMKTKITESGGQTPIWGSIPVLGWLAKNLAHNTEKEYLFLFLCPTILKPRTSPGIGMYTRMNLHQAAKEVESAIVTTKSNDPVYNWFFNSSGENYSHKVIDFSNARYQPNNVDIRYDSYFRSESQIPQTAPRSIALPASPQDYTAHGGHIEEKQNNQAHPVAPEPEKTPAVKKESLKPEGATAYNVQRPKKKKAKSAPIEEAAAPATKPEGPETVTLTPDNHIVHTSEQTPEASVEMFDLEKNISNNRAKLRSLLGSNSLAERLSAAPQEPEVVEESDSNVRTKEAPQLMSRRQGIKNFLKANTAETAAPESDDQARSNFASFLGGKSE